MKPTRARKANNEWYTPPEVYLPIKAFLGEIDLDPCADPERSIPAGDHIVDNGLGRTWRGRVFLNPPYAPIQPWIDRALTDPIDEMIMLLPSRTGTKWFQSVLRSCSVCFIKDRICFIRPGQEKRERAMFESVFAYRGPRPEEFCKAFAHWGFIIQGPPAQPQIHQLPLMEVA